jgi:AraC-like DNA-binding protein
MIAARASPSVDVMACRDGRTSQSSEVAHPTLIYCEHMENTVPAEINGREMQIRRGDCFVLPAGTVVQADASLAFDRTVVLDGAEAWIVAFVVAFPKDASLGVGRIRVPSAEREHWGNRLERLQHELTRQAPRSREATQALLTLLAVDAARYVGSCLPKALPSRRVVAEVFGHINAHLAAPISLRAIADALHFSPAYLTDLMKRETGRPLASWIIELRLQRAEHLLLQTDQPISEIAASVGYGDANSFGRAFTKRRGVSPLQWRRQHLLAARTARRERHRVE